MTVYALTLETHYPNGIVTESRRVGTLRGTIRRLALGLAGYCGHANLYDRTALYFGPRSYRSTVYITDARPVAG